MRFDFRSVVDSLLQDGPLTFVLVAGAVLVLARAVATPRRRSAAPAVGP